MEVKYRVERNGLYIYLYGELDEFSAVYCRSKTDEIIDCAVGFKNVVFDFSGVTFMDSSGVGLVMGRYRLCAGKGIKVIITNLSERNYKIMKMSGIEKIAEIKRDL